MAVRQSALDTFVSEWADRYKELAAARSALTAAARRLLVEIMGEDVRRRRTGPSRLSSRYGHSFVFRFVAEY